MRIEYERERAEMRQGKPEKERELKYRHQSHFCRLSLCVTVKLTVQNRQAKVSVVPSTAALVIKTLKELERDWNKMKNIKHNGNILLDDVIKIAKVMKSRSMAKDLSGTVKEILGTCVSVGCTVDGKDPKDLQQEITDGDVEVPLD